MIPEVLPKDCKTIKEAEEYLNSYGIYVWHKGDDVNYIKYLLNIGCFVYVVTKYEGFHHFLLFKANDGDFFTEDFMDIVPIVYRKQNKMLKFIRNGFLNHVYLLACYNT